MGILINNSIFLVTEYKHVKPGKGGAFARIKLKNVKTGQVLDKTIKQGDKLEDVPLEERKIQNLYKSGDGYHLSMVKLCFLSCQVSNLGLNHKSQKVLNNNNLYSDANRTENSCAHSFIPTER